MAIISWSSFDKLWRARWSTVRSVDPTIVVELRYAGAKQSGRIPALSQEHVRARPVLEFASGFLHGRHFCGATNLG